MHVCSGNLDSHSRIFPTHLKINCYPKIITRKNFDLIEIDCLFTWLSKAKRGTGKAFSAQCWAAGQGTECILLLLLFSASQLSYQAKLGPRHFYFSLSVSYHQEKKYIYQKNFIPVWFWNCVYWRSTDGSKIFHLVLES